MEEGTLAQRSAWTSLLVTGFLLAALIISGGGRSRWPFSYWEMYSAVPSKPAQKVSSLQLVVRDEHGRSHRIWPKDLFTLDDDASSQPTGPTLIRAALKSGSTQVEHQEGLARRVEDVLGRNIREVKVRSLSWNVEFGNHPAFEKARPDSEKTLITIQRKP